MTTVVVVLAAPTDTYSLEASAARARDTTTLTYEFEAVRLGGATTFGEVQTDLDQRLTSMTMNDDSDGSSEYVFDIARNRVYVEADLYSDIGFDVGDAEWIRFDLDEMWATEASGLYDQSARTHWTQCCCSRPRTRSTIWGSRKFMASE